MPRAQRARFESQLGMGALTSLTDAMPAWIRSAGLDAESFRQHFFPHDSARAAARIQAVAAAIGHGDDLRPAMEGLAGAVQVVGLDNAPRVLAAAAARAANSAAPAGVPAHSGLVKEVAYDDNDSAMRAPDIALLISHGPGMSLAGKLAAVDGSHEGK